MRTCLHDKDFCVLTHKSNVQIGQTWTISIIRVPFSGLKILTHQVNIAAMKYVRNWNEEDAEIWAYINIFTMAPRHKLIVFAFMVGRTFIHHPCRYFLGLIRLNQVAPQIHSPIPPLLQLQSPRALLLKRVSHL